MGKEYSITYTKTNGEIIQIYADNITDYNSTVFSDDIGESFDNIESYEKYCLKVLYQAGDIHDAIPYFKVLKHWMKSNYISMKFEKYKW